MYMSPMKVFTLFTLNRFPCTVDFRRFPNRYSPTSNRCSFIHPAISWAIRSSRLGGGEQLELHFDDLDANVKNYSYTFQLCNADWTPAMLKPLRFYKRIFAGKDHQLPYILRLPLPVIRITRPRFPTGIAFLPGREIIY